MEPYYKITYRHRGETQENALYLPGDNKYALLSAELSLEVGKSGTLTLEIPPGHPAYGNIQYLTDEVLFYRRGEELWRGRPVTAQEDFYRTGTLTCEGALSYLYDTYYPPYDYQGMPEGLLRDVLTQHNSQVPADRQLQPGMITVTDPNDYIARSNQDYSRSLNVLTDKLVGESLGGYLRVRVEDGIRYLDYLKSYDHTADQSVRLGVNLLDLAQTVEYSSLATVLLPLGKRDEETGKRLDIASVNGGSIYIEDTAAVAKYGRIVSVQIWDDVTEAQNLLTKGQQVLGQLTSAVSSVTIKSVDLAIQSQTETAINLGDAVLTQSEPHGINQYFELTGLTIHPLNPAEDTLTFGGDMAGLTERQSQNDRATQGDLAQLAVRLDRVTATYVTTDYLSANYVTITNLNAVNADIETLTAQTAEIQTAIIGKADITDLEAATAHIGDLSADVANIETLLAGNVGTGNLQAIHITGDNVVIDNAVITDAMIASLTASKLTAGTLYTSLIQIASDQDEHLLIDGATLQIKDSHGTVRVQIGQDDSGDYNYYLWDADGHLMWSPTGVTAAGLNDGIIRDINVAEDAAISGDKLDITSVAQRLNEDGSLTVEAGQVTIDGTKLDVAYQTITDNTEAAQQAAAAAREKAETAASDAAAAQATADQAQANAATAQTAAEQAQANAAAAQSTADTAKSHAATAQAAADQAKANAAAAQTAADQAQADYNDLAKRADTTEAELSAAQTKLEQAQADATAAQTAADDAQAAADAAQAEAATAQNNAVAAAQAASQAQSTADAASAQAETAQQAAEEAQAAADAAAQELANIRQVTTTIQTDLSVIQGQIASKVWQTDITSAVNPLGQEINTLQDQYTTLNQTMDGLQGEVGDLTTTVSENYRELDSKLTEISITAEGLQTQVSSVQTTVETVQQEAMTASTAYYYQSTSATALTGGSWSTESPVWKEGTYIWVRYQLTYGDGSTSYTTAVCLTGNTGKQGPQGEKGKNGETGATGPAGADGQDGKDGVGIQSVTNYYLATTASSGVTATTSGWTTTVQSITSSKRYLWNYELVTYTDNSSTKTTPAIIGVWGNTGATGAAGKGISSITEYYAVSSSNTTAPTSWATSLVNTTTTNKYLWNYEQITYTDGSSTNTTKRVIGTHGATGATGPAGADGVDGQMLYATCSTAAGTAAKVATLSSGSLILSAGATVAVKFSNANTASAPTLNVASKGAKSMYLGSAVVSASNPFKWSAGATIIFVYNGTYWVVADAGSYQDLASVSETFSSRIEQLADSISLSVTGSLGGTASIVLSVDGQATSKSLDLSKVRDAFANDKSAVTISAGTVAFAANTLVVDSNNFTLDQNGNVSLSGIITAKAGSKLGGWSITDGKIYAGSEEDGTTCVMQIPGGTGGAGGIPVAKTVFAAGGSNHSDYSDCKFRVTCDGRMYIDSIYTSYLYSNNDQNAIDVRAALYSSYAINCDTTITTDNYFRASDIYNKNTTATKAAYWDSNGYLKAYSGSSQRHKHDITPLTAYDPEVLYDLPVKQFVYNEDYLDDYDDLYQKIVPGIIAEDLEKLLPIAVSYDKEGRVDDWKDRLVLCCMLRLLQDQHRELEDLKQQIGGIKS